MFDPLFHCFRGRRFRGKVGSSGGPAWALFCGTVRSARWELKQEEIDFDNDSRRQFDCHLLSFAPVNVNKTYNKKNITIPYTAYNSSQQSNTILS
ncbi:hypothetical protein DPMN_151380 [Dreissena polymorpha]|uniref:Uncharacterized protein n=1 Tax=Dreissena polymorpha TaxID=45954 RepID=A0A9D4J6W6_DREPO|nr:hypothetical protein DPMN_151380 [Dreissena polymorpha]